MSWVMKSAVLMSECKEFIEFFVVKFSLIISFIHNLKIHSPKFHRFTVFCKKYSLVRRLVNVYRLL